MSTVLNLFNFIQKYSRQNRRSKVQIWAILSEVTCGGNERRNCLNLHLNPLGMGN